MEVKTKSGLIFSNLIGVGPGLDVYGRGIDGLLDSGFGFVEIGSVTAE